MVFGGADQLSTRSLPMPANENIHLISGNRNFSPLSWQKRSVPTAEQKSRSEAGPDPELSDGDDNGLTAVPNLSLPYRHDAARKEPYVPASNRPTRANFHVACSLVPVSVGPRVRSGA